LKNNYKAIKDLLYELWKSQNVTVEALFNTRVCRSLNYVKDFSQAFCQEIDENEGSISEAHVQVKEILEFFSSQLKILLERWKNFVITTIFDDKNDDLIKEIGKSTKKAIKKTMSRVKQGKKILS
jgi:hypothetical protein